MLSERGAAAKQNLNASVALHEVTISTSIYLVNTVTIHSLDRRTFETTHAREFQRADGALFMLNRHAEHDHRKSHSHPSLMRLICF